MDELRSLFSLRLTRGALLRPDGVAVGLVVGGAPPWELLARPYRAQAAEDYHRMLLALDAPLDIYLVDEPSDASAEVDLLLSRQRAALDDGRSLHAAVLGEICGYVTDLAGHSAGRGKQVVWAAPAGPALTGGGVLAGLLGSPPRAAGARDVGRAAIAPGVERARRLADALGALGAAPPARLPEPEEIASILYRLADPVRAQRYPLAGPLLDRVRRVVGVDID